ncbi:hypothetical protein [uncultured Hyphomicrobium sp.]|uniref:hypothetical protein n=1 Tax=uncultured Hyphomicrobium sp. TaxID=194373 RepID=UPI0025DCBD15|nr:hypothetical protein [uncultured Hyphomicrobium sp.]
MISRASIALLVLLVGSVSLPAGFASAADSSAASKAQLQKAQQAKALRAKKAKQQQLARQQQLAKQQEEQKKKEWYENDRDRGLDIASEYAPKEIAKVRKNNYIAKGDTVSTGNGKKGWQQYMNKYYSR